MKTQEKTTTLKSKDEHCKQGVSPDKDTGAWTAARKSLKRNKTIRCTEKPCVYSATLEICIDDIWIVGNCHISIIDK